MTILSIDNIVSIGCGTYKVDLDKILKKGNKSRKRKPVKYLVIFHCLQEGYSRIAVANYFNADTQLIIKAYYWVMINMMDDEKAQTYKNNLEDYRKSIEIQIADFIQKRRHNIFLPLMS